jgi:hypothetical protein
MGTCSSFFNGKNLAGIINQYNIKNFVETGTGMGASVEWATQQPFHNIWSVEIHQPTFEIVSKKFINNSKVKIWNCPSVEFLENACTLDGGILFFLDAHFPGSYYHGIELSTGTDDIMWPLELELPLISKMRPIGKDLILLDDLRIYENGPYGSGLCPPQYMRNTSMDIMGTTLLTTHTLTKHYLDEGYALFTPK